MLMELQGNASTEELIGKPVWMCKTWREGRR